MTPTLFHRLQRSVVFAREHDQPATSAPNVDRKCLIVGGSIGLLMLICAVTFLVQGTLRHYFKKRRQAKEMEGYSLELQEARREKAAERVNNREEGAGVKAVAMRNPEVSE